ncbi:hypothetical protein D9M68_693940 [compost metagenome]
MLHRGDDTVDGLAQRTGIECRVVLAAAIDRRMPQVIHVGGIAALAVVQICAFGHRPVQGAICQTDVGAGSLSQVVLVVRQRAAHAEADRE